MKNQRKLIIQNQVYSQAEEIYQYVKANSSQNAEKFRKELLKQIDKVESNPELYSPEKFLNKVRILYRFALVMKSWKLVFKVTKKLIVVLGVIHTSRNPKELEKYRTTKYDK